MITPLIAALLSAQAAPAGSAAPTPIPDATPVLSQESRALLRCSAAFALVSRRQADGDPAALRWPVLEIRGREFFVRSLAQLMDKTGLDRGSVAMLAQAEAAALQTSGESDTVMPACLVMLESSGV
ncbi:MAG: hypothetical protein NWP98_00335 [Erythrobacter sp.]|nr:hypothetical protein [Erythrobacter sp.]